MHRARGCTRFSFRLARNTSQRVLFTRTGPTLTQLNPYPWPAHLYAAITQLGYQ